MSLEFDVPDIATMDPPTAFHPGTRHLDAELAQFRQGSLADGTTTTLKAMMARQLEERRGASQTAAVPSAAVIEQHRTAQEASSADAHAVVEHEQAVQDQVDDRYPTSGSGTGGGSGSSSTAGTEVTATTDMGDAAHVGDTSVTSAASEDNLQNDTPDDDEAAQVTATRLARANAQIEEEHAAELAAQEAAEIAAQALATQEAEAPVVEEAVAEPVEVMPATVAVVDDSALVQRVLVRRGEPLTDAEYTKQGMRFDDSGSKQISNFPSSLEEVLRADLASMSNDAFARALPISQLVSAYVAAQLGAMPTAEQQAEMDPNTAQALAAFRMLDRRTGAIEEGIARLDALCQEVDMRSKKTLDTFVTYAQQIRRQENALAFLVSERISPTMNMQQTSLHQLILTGGNYRNIRDLLRQQTEKEMTDERIQRGRPMR